MLQNNLQYTLAKITLFNIDNKTKRERTGNKKRKKRKKGEKKDASNVKLKYP